MLLVVDLLRARASRPLRAARMAALPGITYLPDSVESMLGN